MQKPAPLTLRRGALQKGSKFWDWFHQINMNASDPKSATLSLLDSEGNTRMRWSLKHIWPAKITAADLSSHSNELAIESMELNYENYTLENL